MFLNFKLYFSYVFLHTGSYSFVDNLSQRSRTSNILIPNEALMYTSIHMKFSTPLSQTQLCDIFSYEIPQTSLKPKTLHRDAKAVKSLTENKPVLVYNFHSLLSQNRFFLFIHNYTQLIKSRNITFNSSADSVSELFFAANWLEREAGELHGIAFSGKKDLRNLMLQYGDNSSPFRKSVPTIGFSEFVYDSLKDTVVKQDITSGYKTVDNYLFV